MLLATLICLTACGSVYCTGGDCLDPRADAAYAQRKIAKQHRETARRYRLLSTRHWVRRWLQKRLDRLLQSTLAASEDAEIVAREVQRSSAQVGDELSDERLNRPGTLRATVHVIDDPTQPLAFTEIGGHVYVSTGLLIKHTRSCGEAVAVLAHELGHLVLKHPAMLWRHRSDEYHADRLAVLLLHLARYMPDELASFLRRNAESTALRPCPDPFRGAHPPSLRRVKAIEDALVDVANAYPRDSAGCSASERRSFERLQVDLKFGGQTGGQR